MKCNGPCNQGRNRCPTPQACETPTEDNGMELLGMLFLYCMGITTGAFVAIFFFM